MLRAVIDVAVRRRGVVLALAVVALLFGGQTALHSKLDVLPEFVPPQVSVQTEAPGLAPEQIESLVTKPLENALSGVPSTVRVSSESIPGLSVVNLVFDDAADVYLTRQGVAERLAEMSGRLPAGVAAPRMSPLTSSTMDLLKIGLLSTQLDPQQLRAVADWELRPRLLAVAGVARITVYGGSQQQIVIEIDPARLAAADLSATEVLAAARVALGVRGAGQIDLPAQRISITTALAGDELQVLRSAVVSQRGDQVVRIGDVASVSQGAAIPFGDAVIQGRPGVLLSLSGQYGANTLEATRAVEAVLAAAVPGLRERGIEVLPALHRPASFIETALANLRNALAMGAALIIVVLLLFLRDWRAALISFLAIPLSLLAAVMVLQHYGVALNTLTLGGFAVALGVLVDDAIIYLENILRRLRDNALLPAPASRLSVIREASVEISVAVIYATGVILVVFVPIFLMGGVQGRFMLPLALAFCLSVLASLVVALTVTPALAALLLRDHAVRAESRWLQSLRGMHARSVAACGAHPRRVVLALLGGMVAVLGVLPLLAGEFMPSFREGHFVAQVSSRIPGTSLREMALLGQQISAELLQLPFVATVEQQIGRAEQGEDTWGPERSEFHIELKPGRSQDQDLAQQQVREVLDQYPVVQSEVLTFLGDRVSESMSGETAQGVVLLHGASLEAIELVAADIAQRIGQIPGIADVQRGHTGVAAQWSVNLLPERLALYGLQAAEVLDLLQAAFAGTVVNQVYRGDRTVDVVARLSGSALSDAGALRDLPLRTPNGQSVRLADVAQIYLATGRAAIRHEAGERVGVITFNAGTRSIQPVTADVRSVLDQEAGQHPELWLELSGEAQAQQSTQRNLLTYSALALGLILIVLAAAFRRQALAWLVMLNLPFSLVGGVLALALTGQTLSLGALVGLVTVFGISARNAILLLAHYEQLLDHEGAGAWSRGLILQGAGERLLPVTMTALVTALGLIPLALAVGQAGNEIEAPLAIVVLGGLVSSTLLCLIVLPAVLQWILASRFAGTLQAHGESTAVAG